MKIPKTLLTKDLEKIGQIGVNDLSILTSLTMLNIESLEKRINDLEGRQRIAETLSAVDDNVLLKRIKIIEDFIGQNYKKDNEAISMRLKELERFQDITHLQYQKVINKECKHTWEYGLQDGAICNKCGVVKHD